MSRLDFIHTPPNEAGSRDDLYAYVSVDEHGEGICAGIVPRVGATPLITARRHLAEGLFREVAREIAASGRKVRLVRYARAEVLWESA